MWTDKVHQFIISPTCGLLATFIFAAIALSGRFSVNLSNLLLIAALLIGCFEIFRLGQAIHLNIILCLLLGIILTAISWWITPNPQTKQSTEKSAIQQQQQVSKELFSQNFPGISFQTLIQLNEVSTKANHKKYIFDFGRIDGSRLSLYLSSGGIFTFLLIDANGERYPIQAPIGNSGVPFGKFFYLVCEIGIDGQSTVMRMIIDEKEFKSDRLLFKVDLGGISVPGGVVGADLNGQNCASFDMVRLIVLSTTMTTFQAAELKKSMDDYVLASPHYAFIEYNGKQWMRFNKSGFSDLSQDNKLFQPTWKKNKSSF
jgi:hypothetical protein